MTRQAYLRPQGHAVLPHAPSPAPPSSAAVWPQPLALPRGTRRIIILSNVTRGFSVQDIPLQPGDLCIHLNHARHRAAAMAVKGTRHALLVRHGKGADPLGFHWYGPDSYDGFCRVIHVDDTQLCAPLPWYAEFKARGGASPTTGFIAANLCRALFPSVPLVLAGFDPGTPHGTPLWSGHTWELERTWYAEKQFTLIIPQNNG